MKFQAPNRPMLQHGKTSPARPHGVAGNNPKPQRPEQRGGCASCRGKKK